MSGRDSRVLGLEEPQPSAEGKEVAEMSSRPEDTSSPASPRSRGSIKALTQGKQELPARSIWDSSPTPSTFL